MRNAKVWDQLVVLSSFRSVWSISLRWIRLARKLIDMSGVGWSKGSIVPGGGDVCGPSLKVGLLLTKLTQQRHQHMSVTLLTDRGGVNTWMMTKPVVFGHLLGGHPRLHTTLTVNLKTGRNSKEILHTNALLRYEIFKKIKNSVLLRRKPISP